jgi:osmotically-inducible protein OsmY
MATAHAPAPLETLISSTISAHPHLKRRKLRVETREGRVILRGVVNSYYHKQLAQEAVRRLQGVATIENHLEVDWAVSVV